MTQDQNRKTLRHFQCRDYLWEVFEQMSRELECSTDYLVNEAMRLYARSRNYSTRGGSQGPPPIGSPHATGGGPSSPGGLPPMRQPGPMPGYGGQPGYGNGPAGPPAGPPGGYGGGYGQQQSAAYGGPSGGGMPGGGMPGGGMPGGGMPGGAPQSGGYPPANYGYGGPPGSPPGSGPGQGGFSPPHAANGPGAVPSMGGPPPRPPGPPPGVPSSAPPPLPGHPSYGAGAMPPLAVIFNGQKIPIGKPEFVIGRGSKTADLPIKDGNISRRHAAVVFENGGFFMKDLGSTNGIEFGGHRIDNKPIQEGDIFQICDYELRFTYR